MPTPGKKTAERRVFGHASGCHEPLCEFVNAAIAKVPAQTLDFVNRIRGLVWVPRTQQCSIKPSPITFRSRLDFALGWTTIGRVIAPQAGRRFSFLSGAVTQFTVVSAS
jgi:hypothetical protein